MKLVPKLVRPPGVHRNPCMPVGVSASPTIQPKLLIAMAYDDEGSSEARFKIVVLAGPQSAA
jgi:hypothetical protein